MYESEAADIIESESSGVIMKMAGVKENKSEKIIEKWRYGGENKVSRHMKM
jgi:hypothetical protein